MLSKDITIINGMARTKDSVKTKDSYEESTIYIGDKPAKVGTTLMDRNTGNAVKVTYISSDQIGIGGIYYDSSDKRIDSRYYVMDSKTKDGNGEQALDRCRHSLFPVANELASIASSSIYEDSIRKAAKKAEQLVDEARHVLFDVI